MALDYAGYTPSPNAPKVSTYLNGAAGIVESRTGTSAAQTLPAYSLTTFTLKPKLSRTLPPAAGTPTVSAVTDSTATVTWKAVPRSVRTAGYDVYLQEGDATRLAGHTDGTSLALDGLDPGSRYTVTVVTRDKAGAESWSILGIDLLAEAGDLVSAERVGARDDTAAVLDPHGHLGIGHGRTVGVLDEAEIRRPFLFAVVVVVAKSRPRLPRGQWIGCRSRPRQGSPTTRADLRSSSSPDLLDGSPAHRFIPQPAVDRIANSAARRRWLGSDPTASAAGISTSSKGSSTCAKPCQASRQPHQSAGGLPKPHCSSSDANGCRNTIHHGPLPTHARRVAGSQEPEAAGAIGHIVAIGAWGGRRRGDEFGGRRWFDNDAVTVLDPKCPDGNGSEDRRRRKFRDHLRPHQPCPWTTPAI